MSDSSIDRGLSLAPIRALRYTAGARRLGALLCPPYDVIDDDARSALLATEPDNAVRVVLPRADGAAPGAPGQPGGAASVDDPYRQAAQRLDRWLSAGVVAVDEQPAIYVYEMRSPGHRGEAPSVTRGLVGAVELRDPEDGVILPHENTMAGPVADRLALMSATDANLEPIYLVYDGGGAASRAVASVAGTGGSPAVEPDPAPAVRTGDDPSGTPALIASAETPDGVVHRLWAITDPAELAAIEADLSTRHALIADGHHRYATYRQLAAQRNAERGPGPWDRGLALLVDSSAYGPQVHPIHRVVPGLSFDDAVGRAGAIFTVERVDSVDDAVTRLSAEQSTGSAGAGFAVAITDGSSVAMIGSPAPEALAAARGADEPETLMDLDVSILHRVLIEQAWQLTDDEHHVGYAHEVDEALASAKTGNGIAVLVRATPVAAVAAVAAAGARMPRKSTFFTPKPASGLVMRRFADQGGIED